jgi:NAD(P)-dependent dehydrogenase (short-subunit alcohol dehydrogenase family)
MSEDGIRREDRAEDLPGLSSLRLDGHLAVITGGSRGLGWAMACGLASAGADVLLVSRNKDQLAEKAKQLADRYGTRAWGHGADVSDPECVAGLKDFCLSQIGSPSIVINNAGINIRGAIDELSFAQFKQVLSTNVDSAWLVTRAFIEEMKRRRYGRIIHIASTLGLVGLAGRTPYTASKGAIVQLTRAMAVEFAPWNVTCNAICPGPFLTEMNREVADHPDIRTNLVGATALGRWGELKEIQGAAIYLASPASSFTTGSMVVVDGGWAAR